jgi:hypothetical protein
MIVDQRHAAHPARVCIANAMPPVLDQVAAFHLAIGLEFRETLSLTNQCEHLVERRHLPGILAEGVARFELPDRTQSEIARSEQAVVGDEREDNTSDPSAGQGFDRRSRIGGSQQPCDVATNIVSTRNFRRNSASPDRWIAGWREVDDRRELYL